MQIYRIAQESFALDFSGKGAWINGGRWNSEGRFALYASESRALAMLETLAHTPAKMLTIKPYMLVTLELPDKASVEQLPRDMLPVNWQITQSNLDTAKLGDRFLQKNKSLLLKVPSIIMPEEWNYVLNPLHAEMKKLKSVNSRKVIFDNRLF